MHLLPGKRFTTLNTIYHADAMDLLRTLDDDSVDMVLTDPPYGVTQNKWDVMPDLAEWWTHIKRILKPNSAVVVTAVQPFTSLMVMSNLEMYRHDWVWNKKKPVGHLNVKIRPMRLHEDVLVFANNNIAYTPQMSKGKPYSGITGPVTGNYGSFGQIPIVNNGTRYPVSIIEFPMDSGLHPTQKPVSLFEYLIRTYTRPGQVVLDPYMGSGTTAVAALTTDRQYIGCELDAGYHAAAVRRVQNVDPTQPTILEDGSRQLSLFAEIV